MIREIEIKSGKNLKIPSRMFRDKDIENMGIEYVERKIFFNKSDFKGNFSTVKPEIKKQMSILNYPDCSDTKFSIDTLLLNIKKQIECDDDFIVISSFKKETEYDTMKRIELAGKIKTHYNKDIIFEISYKITPQVMDRIIEQSDNFDFLAIFYGVHYGRHPSFIELCRKIFWFKQKTGKKVFCIGVPLIFSGDRFASSSHLFPIWELISDGWVRNWKCGGGSKEIRLIDFEDFKNKNFQGWCEKHQSNEIIKYVNVSVKSLFNKGIETQRLREIYTRGLMDEAVNEVSLLVPNIVWKYLSEKAPEMYQTVILRLYDQRLIQYFIRESEWANFYAKEEIELLEKELMTTLDPSKLEEEIRIIVEKITKEQKVPVAVLIDELNRVRNFRTT